MRKRLIFIAGVGVGYLLGTRAGRERFDQIVAQAHKVWESPTVQEAAGVVQEQATKLYDDGKQAVSDQINKLSRRNGATGNATTRNDVTGSSVDDTVTSPATSKDEALNAAGQRPRHPTTSF